MLHPSGEDALVAQLWFSRRVNFDDVETIHESRLANVRTRFAIRLRRGGRVRLTLRDDQARSVRHLLMSIDRVHQRVDITSPMSVRAGFAIALSVLGLGLGGFSTVALAMGDPEVEVFLAAAVFGWILCILGLWLLYARRARGPLATPHHDKPATVRRPDGSRRLPFRSPSLGLLLKVAGVLYWIAIASQSAAIQQLLGEDIPLAASSRIWFLIWAPAPVLVLIGHRLGWRHYVPKQAEDARQPILFLRSFDDDGSTTFQPCGLVADLAGLRSELGARVDGSPGRVRAGELMLAFNPITLVRMAVGYGSATAEESITRFFESYGPVVAIGKPGEKLATSGAARMYVDDASWQDAILEEMRRAQIVVIQPGLTEGVAWELTQVRRLVTPRRVLLSLVRCWRDPEAFDTLSCIVSDTLGIDLPRNIPFLDRPAFVQFDTDWSASIQEVSYRTPLLWPFSADATDLEYSLAAFLKGLDGKEGSAPSRPRWTAGAATTAAQFGGLILGFVVSAAPIVALKQAAGLLPSLAADAMSSTPSTTLSGRSVRYQVEVPGSLTNLQPNNPLIEYWLRSADGRFQMQIVASREREDLSRFAQQRLDVNRAAPVEIQSVSSRIVNGGGFEWTQSDIVTKLQNGIVVRETARATGSRLGTVILLFHAMEFRGSVAPYDQITEQVFQSFRVVGVDR
jgi:hypothetical protein